MQMQIQTRGLESGNTFVPLLQKSRPNTAHLTQSRYHNRVANSLRPLHLIPLPRPEPPRKSLLPHQNPLVSLGRSHLKWTSPEKCSLQPAVPGATSCPSGTLAGGGRVGIVPLFTWRLTYFLAPLPGASPERLSSS